MLDYADFCARRKLCGLFSQFLARKARTAVGIITERIGNEIPFHSGEPTHMARMVPAAARRSRTVMMAAVLGTALVAGANSARGATKDVSPQAIQDISRYCQACWRNARLPADHWPDCTQEVLTRLLETLEPRQWMRVLQDDEGEERREFLRAIDAVKKRTQRARKFASLTPDVPEHSRIENVLRDDREVLAQAVTDVLSARQRSILQLTTDGWTVPEIADELGTTVERISDEKYKAIRKLRHHFGVA